jgi:hypothetical protein
MTLPGLRSRWTIPESVGKLDAVAKHLLDGERALREPVGKRLSLDEFHDQEVHTILVTHVVQRANVRV